MKTFGNDDELVLLDGVRDGLGSKWSFTQEWLTVVAKPDVVVVSMQSPLSPSLFRMQEIFLDKIDDNNLYKAGLAVGAEMKRYLGKNRKLAMAGQHG